MEFETFKDGILRLATESMDMSLIKSYMTEFYIDKPISIVKATPPFLARSRPNMNGQVFDRKCQISYNPKPNEIKMQRANLAGQQVFYGAVPTQSDFGSCQNTALLETVMEHVKDHTIERQLITLSRWRINRPLDVCILPFSPESCRQNQDFNKANEKYLNYMDETLRHISTEKREDYLNSLRFISEIFCQNTNKEVCYKISAVYYNLILFNAEKNGIILDGLIYPSANTGAAGMNVVLRKDLVDESAIELDYVVMMEMIRSKNNPKHITFDGASEEMIPDQEGNFYFSRKSISQ